MLDVKQLSNALKDAQKDAGVCARWCVVGAEIESENYRVWHQGIRDADVQVIYAPAVLGMYEVGLKSKLQEWIVSLHKRTPLDLNAVAGFAISTEGRLVWLDDEQTTYESSAD